MALLAHPSRSSNVRKRHRKKSQRRQFGEVVVEPEAARGVVDPLARRQEKSSDEQHEECPD